MSKPSLPFALLLALLTAAPALAQDDPQRCYTTSDPRCTDANCGNTFYNPSVSLNWQRTQQAADPRIMQQIAGVYYGEVRDATGRMLEQIYRSYEANGLWQYRDQTCTIGSQIPCSQNQGAGQWAAYGQQDGSVFVMIHFSDLSRSNTCFSQTIRGNGRGFVDEYGNVWQRTG